MISRLSFLSFFFFNDTATTEIYTLSLHDALPICKTDKVLSRVRHGHEAGAYHSALRARRSEEHTSELQSQSNLVCRLLLEKKKKLRKRSWIIAFNTFLAYVSFGISVRCHRLLSTL